MFFIVVNVCRSDDVDTLAPFIVLFDCLFLLVVGALLTPKGMDGKIGIEMCPQFSSLFIHFTFSEPCELSMLYVSFFLL